MTVRAAIVGVVFASGLVVGCSRERAEEEAKGRIQNLIMPSRSGANAPAAPAMAAQEADEKPMRRMAKTSMALADSLAANAMPEAPREAESKEMAEPGGEGSGGGGEPARTRAYFPETFLFEPLVLTDESGSAHVEVRVPDRLTTWRVLALAHSREGAQAGAVTTFVGTLPAYLDPIVPGRLFAGDEVRLPIQVVNTTDAPIARTLEVTVTGAAHAKATGPVRVEAGSSRVEQIPIHAEKPGVITLRASLGDKDAIERVIPVLPTGQPFSARRGGTLAKPREVALELPKDADASATTARLLVYPGALAILRSELGAAGGRGGAAEDAYALLLAGRGASLLEKLGGEPDTKALRAMGLVASQRALRAARSPEPLVAALFVEPALAHPENPVLSRLASRLVLGLAGEQRPDGTFLGGQGFSLQRLLVATAECVRALRVESRQAGAAVRAERAKLLASGAFERNFERVEDGYTAAVILASGVVSGPVANKLRARVVEGLQVAADGSRFLGVDQGVVRADGSSPTVVEATAFAALALKGDPARAAEVPDLGAYILGAYDPRSGFGDGRTNLIALQAVLALFDARLPAHIDVSLAVDGREVASGVLEGAKLKDVLVLDVPLARPGGAHTYTVSAEPPVPGLAFALAVSTYLPWAEQAAELGLELAIEPPKSIKVGEAGDLLVSAAAPAGNPFTIELSLPAGVQIDRGALEALRAAGAVTRFELGEGALTLEVAPLAPSQSFSAHLRAIPTLAGALRSGASSISMGAATQLAPPRLWSVAAVR